MGKKDLVPEDDVVHYVKIAALYPQRRSEMITRALQKLLVRLSAVGTALVWPCQDRNFPWQVYYAGEQPESMRHWLAARLNFSVDTTLGVLQQDLSKLPDMPFPHIVCLQPAPTLPTGLWIIWTPISPLPREALDYQEEVQRTLEALIEVESLESHYFSSASPLFDQGLIKGLVQGESQALSALLSVTRLVGKADLTAWGRAYQDVVECTDHIGAKQSGFGFTLPRRRGLAGRIVISGIPVLSIEDYRNSQYRYPSASDIVDREEVRSIISLPVHTNQGEGRAVTGILYATRRTVQPFALADQLLVQRITQLLEPLPPATRSLSFPSTGLPYLSDEQEAWYKLVLHANRIDSLERWVSEFIKGTIIVTDSDGRPYVATQSERLEELRASLERSEKLRASLERSMDSVQTISLAAPGVSSPGQIYLRSGINLPPGGWPNFFADLIMACNLVIGRMELARDHLACRREQWLHTVLQEEALPYIYQDGRQLGLPVGEGQLWVIAWPGQGQGQAAAPTIRQSARKRMLAENIVLDQLESPLLFLGSDIGVILLDEHAEPDPSRLHQALCALFVPHPLWIVYGARYHSLQDLKMALTHCITLAQKARREAQREYLLDLQAPGLESLLANPVLTEELRVFASKLLTPLLEHDKSKGTDLTTTFVLAQMLGSTQTVSDELGVHVNTIRYRLRKAEDLLGIEEASAKERVAWGVASFIWTSFHPVEE